MDNKINITLDDLKKNYKNIIKQTNNDNSYSDLFIVKDDVYKIFDNSQIAKQNLQIIKKLMKRNIHIENLVLPKSLIYYENQVVGYSMPYIKGKTLEELFDSISKEKLKNIFEKLYKLIIKVNKAGINIRDIHEKNIMIDNQDDVYIIDCDSFKIENYKENIPYYGKYICLHKIINEAKFSYHDINTDHFSLLYTLLNLIFQKKKIDIIEIQNYSCNNPKIEELIRTKNINDFRLSKEDLIDIIDNIDKIEFTLRNEYEKLTIEEQTELNNLIKRIRKT